MLRYGTTIKELSGKIPEKTTNNRAEMQAAIEAFKALKEPCKVVFRTDSMFVIYAIKRKGTTRKTKSNGDLVQQLWEQIEKHEVETQWVKGHAGDSDNERCDQLAEDQSKRPF